VEAEEEFITNSLIKQINDLKLEKEKLLINIDKEEECISNILQRKLSKLQKEKVDLEIRLDIEEEAIVNKLQKQLSTLNDEKNTLLSKLNGPNSVEDLSRINNEMNSIEQRLYGEVNQLKKEKFILDQKIKNQQQQLKTLQKEKAQKKNRDITHKNEGIKKIKNLPDSPKSEKSNIRKSRSLSLPITVNLEKPRKNLNVPLKPRKSRGSMLFENKNTNRPQTQEVLYEGYVLQHLESGYDVTRYYVLYEYGFLEGYETELTQKRIDNQSTFSIELDTISSVTQSPYGMITIHTSQGIVNSFSCPDGNHNEWVQNIKELSPNEQQ